MLPALVSLLCPDFSFASTVVADQRDDAVPMTSPVYFSNPSTVSYVVVITAPVFPGTGRIYYRAPPSGITHDALSEITWVPKRRTNGKSHVHF